MCSPVGDLDLCYSLTRGPDDDAGLFLVTLRPERAIRVWPLTSTWLHERGDTEGLLNEGHYLIPPLLIGKLGFLKSIMFCKMYLLKWLTVLNYYKVIIIIINKLYMIYYKLDNNNYLLILKRTIPSTNFSKQHDINISVWKVLMYKQLFTGIRTITWMKKFYDTLP